MTKPNPAVRYFVGKFKNEKRGVHHRVVRQTSRYGIVGVKHVCDRGAWKKTRDDFRKVSALVPTRRQARELKSMLDGQL